MNRYNRNIGTLSVDENKLLKDFKVCVVGCGGLGGYVIEMLARLGIGYITVVDGDYFDESNLNRQIISTENNLNFSKAQSAKDRIYAINKDVYVNSINEYLNNVNGKDILKNHDLVIDALDSINERFILQRVCREFNITLIHGAINSWYGQVSTIYPGDDTLNYIYKDCNKDNYNISNPSFTPANIASIQVSEALKVLLNKGEILRNKLLLVDLLYNDYNIIDINKNLK